MENRNPTERRILKERRALNEIKLRRQKLASQISALNTMVLIILITIVLTIIGWVLWKTAPAPDPIWQKINFCQAHPNNLRCF